MNFPSSPNRYEKWLAGEDYGRHPEEPNTKPTPAPPPSVEEYLQNEDRVVPECMLEPKQNGKKRRHPIHKKKGVQNEEEESVDAAKCRKVRKCHYCTYRFSPPYEMVFDLV